MGNHLLLLHSVLFSSIAFGQWRVPPHTSGSKKALPPPVAVVDVTDDADTQPVSPEFPLVTGMSAGDLATELTNTVRLGSFARARELQDEINRRDLVAEPKDLRIADLVSALERSSKSQLSTSREKALTDELNARLPEYVRYHFNQIRNTNMHGKLFSAIHENFDSLRRAFAAIPIPVVRDSAVARTEWTDWMDFLNSTDSRPKSTEAPEKGTVVCNDLKKARTEEAVKAIDEARERLTKLGVTVTPEKMVDYTIYRIRIDPKKNDLEGAEERIQRLASELSRIVETSDPNCSVSREVRAAGAHFFMNFNYVTEWNRALAEMHALKTQADLELSPPPEASPPPTTPQPRTQPRTTPQPRTQPRTTPQPRTQPRTTPQPPTSPTAQPPAVAPQPPSAAARGGNRRLMSGRTRAFMRNVGRRFRR